MIEKYRCYLCGGVHPADYYCCSICGGDHAEYYCPVEPTLLTREEIDSMNNYMEDCLNEDTVWPGTCSPESTEVIRQNVTPDDAVHVRVHSLEDGEQ